MDSAINLLQKPTTDVLVMMLDRINVLVMYIKVTCPRSVKHTIKFHETKMTNYFQHHDENYQRKIGKCSPMTELPFKQIKFWLYLHFSRANALFFHDH